MTKTQSTLRSFLATLCMLVVTTSALADEPFAAVKAIVGRLAGGYNGAAAEGADTAKANAAMAQFVFAQDGSIAAGAGKVEAADGKIKISASDASGASFALGQYMRHTAKINITWCGNRTIETYPIPTEAVTYTPAVPVRFAYNYCTLSYTMAFWSEKEWREEIDRLALSGYNVALVLQGLQEAWRVTLESVKKADKSRVYSDEQIMRYVSDEAAQAWWHMGNLEGLGGPLGGEKGDYSAPDAYAKFTARCQKDAVLGEYIYAEMMKLGIQPSIQSFVGLVPDCSNQVLADGVDSNGTRFGSAANWGIINEGGWQGYTRPDVVNPLNIAFDEMSKYWYGALVSIYKPETHGYTSYMGGDLFHEGGNKGSLTDANLADVAKKIQDTQAQYFGKNGNIVTWVIQSWQGSPYQGIRNGLDCSKALIQLLDKDMSTTGSVGANYYAYKSTGTEHIPWIWVEVLNFGGNTGMHGGARRLRNLAKIGTDGNHKASFKGYGILSEGLETNPMMYDMINDAFTREVGQTSSIDDTKIQQWISDYCERRYGLVDDNLKTAYGVLINTVFDCSRYQEGCVENMLCAGPEASVSAVSKWGPKGGIEYDPAELYPAAYAFLDAAKAHPELLKLETFQYDFVELFLQLIGERGRVINAEITVPGAKRNLFLKMFDLAERLTASSDRWRLDWHEARTKTVCPGNEGVRGYRRMVTCWADGYAAGQATGLREYAHRAYAGLLKDYYLKRWLAWFDKLDGKITAAQYTAFLSALDDSFMTDELEATPKGDLVKLGEEILETLNPPALTLDAEASTVDWTGATWTDAKGQDTEWIDEYDVNLSGVCTISSTKPVSVGSLTLAPSKVQDVAIYTGYLPQGAENAVKLFTNLSEEDRARVAYFRGTMNGGWVAQGEAKSYQVNDGPEYCEMQMQRVDDGYLKSVRVRTYFNPADNCIWGYSVNAGNISGGVLGANVTGTGTKVATSDGAEGYGIKGFAAVMNSDVTFTGDIAINGLLTVTGGKLTLTTSEQAAAPSDIKVENGTLILDNVGDTTLHNVVVGAGGKIVVAGTSDFTQKIKVEGTKPAKGSIVYQVGNDEVPLAVGSDGYLKVSVGTMKYEGTISNTDLGWKYVTLDDLANCVYVSGGVAAESVTRNENSVTINKIGSNGASVTLTIKDDGSVHAVAYPGIVDLTATPAVARIEETTSGSGGEQFTFTGHLEPTDGSTPIGWTGITLEELENYTFKIGDAVGGSKQLYWGSLNVDIGGNYFTFNLRKGEIYAMVSKSFNGTLTATPPGSEGAETAVAYKNFETIDEAIVAANGEEIIVIADTELKNATKATMVVTIPAGITLKAEGNKLPWDQGNATYNVYGTIDFGSSCKEFGYNNTRHHVLNLYAGSMVKSQDIVSFYTDFTLNVLANPAGGDTVTFEPTFRSCWNTSINVAEGVKLVIKNNIIPRANSGQTGSATPIVNKTGAGELVLGGILADGVDAKPSITVSAGTLSRALEQEEIFTATVNGGTANITSADEDYEVVEPAAPVGNVHTWKSQGILWLYLVTDPGETAQNGPGVKFKHFAEAYNYALQLRKDNPGQTVKLWGMVANETIVKAELAEVGPEMGLTLDVVIAPAGMEVIGWDEPVRYYYTAADTEWKNTTVVTKKQGASVENYTVQAGDIVIFDKNYAGSHKLKDGNTFDTMYIHGHDSDAVKVICTEIEIAKDTNVEIGFEGGHYSIPPKWTINIAENAALTFRNWGTGKGSVVVPEAHFNGKGEVAFHSEITSVVPVTFGKIDGNAIINIPESVIVKQTDAQSFIENPLAGSGKVLVKNVNFAYTLAEGSSVTFEIDSSVEGSWSEVRSGNIVTFEPEKRRVWTNEDAIFVGLKLDEITSGKYTLGGTINGAWITNKKVDTVVFQETEGGVIAQFQAKDSDSTFTGTKYVNVKLTQDGVKILGEQVGQGAARSATYEGYGSFLTTGGIVAEDKGRLTYAMARIAAGMDYLVTDTQSWSVLPGDVIPEDTITLGDYAELTITSALSFKVKGTGNLITTVEPSDDLKAQLQAATWKGTFTFSGVNYGASGTALWDFNPSNWGNEKSVVELKNCKFFMQKEGRSDVPLKLTGANTTDNGYSSPVFTLAKLLGDGTLTIGGSATHQIHIEDASEFAGSINRPNSGPVWSLAIAKVNGEIYYDLATAVAAAGENDTIEILRNEPSMVVTATSPTQKIHVPSGYPGNFALANGVQGLWYKTADLVGDGTSMLFFEKANNQAFGVVDGNGWSKWTQIYLGPTMADTYEGNWMTSTDWASKTGSTLVRNADGKTPFVANTADYQPALIDGNNLRHVSVAADGYKHITTGNLDGWNFVLGLTNGVAVTVADLSKFQTKANPSTMGIYVDATSKLVIDGMTADGDCNGSIELHVASEEGITFKGFKTGTEMQYCLEGNASVNYQLENLAGTHVVKTAQFAIGTGDMPEIRSKKLVGFVSHAEGLTAKIAEGAISITDSEFAATKVVSSDDLINPGAYMLSVKDDGIYLDYVGLKDSHIVWSSGTLWKSSYSAGESPAVFKNMVGETVNYTEGNIVTFKSAITPWLADAAAGKTFEVDGCVVTLMNEGSSGNTFDENAVTIKNGGSVEFQNRWNGTPVIKSSMILVEAGSKLKNSSSYAPSEIIIQGIVTLFGSAADITIPKFKLAADAELTLPTSANYTVVSGVTGKKVMSEESVMSGTTRYALVTETVVPSVPSAPTTEGIPLAPSTGAGEITIFDGNGEIVAGASLPLTATGVYTVKVVENGFEVASEEFAVIAAKEAEEGETPEKTTTAVAVAFDETTVATLLNNSLLSEGDTLTAYVNGAYWMWTLNGAGIWEGATMVRSGSAEGAPIASETSLTRGTAVWVTTAGKIVTFGKYTESAPSVELEEGHNLLANVKTVDAVPENVETGHQVQLIGEANIARYDKTSTGWVSKIQTRTQLPNGQWVTTETTSTVAPKVKPGRGYWLIRPESK